MDDALKEAGQTTGAMQVKFKEGSSIASHQYLAHVVVYRVESTRPPDCSWRSAKSSADQRKWVLPALKPVKTSST